MPRALDLGVKIMQACRPTASASDQPSNVSAPGFQLVITPSRSVVKIAKSVAFSRMSWAMRSLEGMGSRLLDMAHQGVTPPWRCGRGTRVIAKLTGEG